MSGEITPELVERMQALVRAMTKAPLGVGWRHYEEARDIVAELPKPVDPDLIEARKIAADCFLESGQNADATAAEHGHSDSWSTVRAALAAIKRGRELATQSPATGRAAG